MQISQVPGGERTAERLLALAPEFPDDGYYRLLLAGAADLVAEGRGDFLYRSGSTAGTCWYRGETTVYHRPAGR